MNMIDAVRKTLSELRADPRAQLAALETRLVAAEADLKRLEDADAEALLDGQSRNPTALKAGADHVAELRRAISVVEARVRQLEIAESKDAKDQHTRIDDANCAALRDAAAHLQGLIDGPVADAIGDFLEKNATFYGHTKRQDVPGIFKAKLAIDRAINAAIDRTLRGEPSIKPRSIMDEMPSPR
jgi:hypothetical protein